MQKKVAALLRTSPAVRMTKNGILIYSKNQVGGFGYLVNNGKITRVPINLITLTM